MEKSYQFRIITQEKLFYEGEIVSSIIPGEAGSLGVLANHAPLVTTCVPGKLYFREPDGTEKNYLVARGFLEVLNNQVTLLTEKISELEKKE